MADYLIVWGVVAFFALLIIIPIVKTWGTDYIGDQRRARAMDEQHALRSERERKARQRDVDECRVCGGRLRRNQMYEWCTNPECEDYGDDEWMDALARVDAEIIEQRRNDTPE